MGLLLLLLLCFLCALAHATGEVWDVCVCVCERSSGVLVVVRQISGGDDVSMDGGCGREGYGGGGREGEEMKGGVCQLDVRWRGQGMNELPPSLLPLCRSTCHLHGAVTGWNV